MVAARSDVAQPEGDVAREGLLDFKVITKHGRSIWVWLDSQTPAPGRRRRQRCDSGHDLQRKRHICQKLRRSRNGRYVRAAPTDVVQQVVSHPEPGPNARLSFSKRIPSQGRSRTKQPLRAVGCEQTFTNSRLSEQDAVGSLNEADSLVVIRMIAVRELVAQPQGQCESGRELHGILYKPGPHQIGRAHV